MPSAPDPRELLRDHITGLEAKADQLFRAVNQAANV